MFIVSSLISLCLKMYQVSQNSASMQISNVSMSMSSKDVHQPSPVGYPQLYSPDYSKKYVKSSPTPTEDSGVGCTQENSITHQSYYGYGPNSSFDPNLLVVDSHLDLKSSSPSTYSEVSKGLPLNYQSYSIATSPTNSTELSADSPSSYGFNSPRSISFNDNSPNYSPQHLPNDSFQTNSTSSHDIIFANSIACNPEVFMNNNFNDDIDDLNSINLQPLQDSSNHLQSFQQQQTTV